MDWTRRDGRDFRLADAPLGLGVRLAGGIGEAVPGDDADAEDAGKAAEDKRHDALVVKLDGKGRVSHAQIS